jgi:hypothetical protein
MRKAQMAKITGGSGEGRCSAAALPLDFPLHEVAPILNFKGGEAERAALLLRFR